MSAPVSLTSSWATLIVAGAAASSLGLGVVDNASAITNAATQIKERTKPASFKNGGTTLLLRIKYPAAYTASQSLQGCVRGRTGTAQEWEERRNVSGTDIVTFTLSPSTDQVSADGNFKYSYVDPAIHAWDRLGCEELLFGITQILAGSGGGGTDACSLEGKVI